ncbi:lysoplasmalogenase [Streptomyces beihaiensis]|uniref:Lysoplasmalogenase n=1 Tax=Streptomyces beihaiensis TaxID=2984495 RepID=A0ABT3TRT9_9ACTN|nr:lysoplasmalogenase [Streptomyces beihaiensis]MCX3059764.1 lysoplasmalogenase [Streptomyces beihaiensis]
MRLAPALRTGYLAVCAADLVALLAGQHLAHTVLKPLLMPVLVAYAVARGGPRLLSAALLCGWAGDVLLLSGQDAAFLAGMGCFAAGHVCYLVLFARHGRGTGITRHGAARAGGRRDRLLGGAYGLALVSTVAALWPGLPGGMRVPVAGYSLLLTAMAYGASRLGLAAGAGGALFLLSDSLIAMGVADWPAPPVPDFWIMLTYVAAQYLLATGVLARARVTPELPATSGSAPARP